MTDSSSLSLFTEVDLSLHTHCSTCVQVTRCMFLNSTERYGCEVICCPNECGRLFHMCKTEEHLSLCPLHKSPCTNAAYGCPVWMCRKDINGHLSVCPASVLYCKMERNRKPTSDSAKKQLKTVNGRIDIDEDFDNKALDLHLALSDQNVINDSYHYSRKIRNRCTNFFCKYHPPLPILRTDKDSSVLTSYVDEGNTSEEDEKKRRRKMAPVARECVLCRVDPSSQHLHVLGSIIVNVDENANEDSSNSAGNKKDKRDSISVCSDFYNRHNLLVDITADFLPSHYPKQRNYYTIVCSETVRRDEHDWHYANVHADVVSNLDGWGFLRCPLFLYGCEMYHTRLQPADGNSEIVYNTVLDALMLRKNDCDNRRTGDNVNLVSLPVDALCIICNYLDSASLYSISMTCHSLRHVCRLLLPQRGMVQLKWVKTVDDQGRVRWMCGPKVWSFSKCFQSVPKWKVVPAHGLVDHIQQCPCYRPVVHTKPMPVLTFAPPPHLLGRRVTN